MSCVQPIPKLCWTVQPNFIEPTIKKELMFFSSHCFWLPLLFLLFLGIALLKLLSVSASHEAGRLQMGNPASTLDPNTSSPPSATFLSGLLEQQTTFFPLGQRNTSTQACETDLGLFRSWFLKPLFTSTLDVVGSTTYHQRLREYQKSIQEV